MPRPEKTHRQELDERAKREKPVETRERVDHLADDWLEEIDRALEECNDTGGT